MKNFPILFILIISLIPIQTNAQDISIELNKNWQFKNQKESKWYKATVPGTVLSMLVNNGLVPDPEIGLNNKQIPDINESGRGEYTYWFYSRFRMADMIGDKQFWLKFRGLNYFAEIFLNGEKVNHKIDFLFMLNPKNLN